MSDSIFHYATLTIAASWRPQGYTPALREVVVPGLEALGARFFGAWAPQFGLAGNQFVLITSWDADAELGAAVERALRESDAIESFEATLLAPTARPTTADPVTRPGVYVHRWFDLPAANVDEAVELSAAAWTSFEDTFQVEPIGLFRALDDGADPTRLLLMSWYPSLAAWEASRNFDADPESKRRFWRRAALTNGTRAISTTLL